MDCISASEAVFAFMSLLNLYEGTFEIGEGHDASVLLPMMILFCEKNELELPKGDFRERLKFPELKIHENK